MIHTERQTTPEDLAAAAPWNFRRCRFEEIDPVPAAQDLHLSTLSSTLIS